MRPTFMGFETARKGLMATQKGLDIAGNNVTNLQTVGYTRQRVDYVSVASSTSGKYGGSVALAGQGVRMNGVSQVRDSFLDKRFREEYADVGYFDQNTQILSDIESALDEVSSSGMKDAIKNMVTALNEFSKNPDQSTHANIVLTAAKNMTQVLNQFDNKLNNVLSQQTYNATVASEKVNSILERIANLNETISGDVFLTSGGNEYYGPNELLDQRNVLLDELSKYGEIKVTQQKDGSVTVEMNGHQVVENGKFETMNFLTNTDGTVSLNWQSTGDPVKLNSGALKSFTDMINGRGSAATGIHENFEKGVPYYKDKINAMAQSLMTVFNSTMETKATNAVYQVPPNAAAFGNGTHTVSMTVNGVVHDVTITVPADGTTMADQARVIAQRLNAVAAVSNLYDVKADNAGNLIITAKNEGVDTGFTGITGFNGTNTHSVTVPGLDAGQVTKTLFEPADLNQVNAGNITISEVWARDPNYIITDLNGDGSGDNTYILAMLNVFNTEYDFGEFRGTFEDYVNFYNTTLGQQKDFNLTRLDATAAIADEMLNRRDAISGVSLDEEGTNLMTYDKAYKAVSRLMTTLDEALDTLINRTGLVGR